METWMIVAIVVAIALIVYYMRKKRTLIAAVIPPAPGVSAHSGYVPNNEPLPGQNAPPVVGSNGILQHIPIVGGLASGVFHGTTNAVLALDKGVGNVLDHVPVVGHVLSAPTKVAGAIASKIFSIF